MSEQQITDYDVTIVGGGMVGLTLACALARAPGLRIAVLEANQPELDWAEGSIGLRVSAITHASRKVFEQIGAWPAMLAEGVTSYSQMHVWDAAGSGEIHFDGADIGNPSLGYIIENRVIQAALWRQAQQLPNVDLLCPARWQQWQESQQCLSVSLDDGRVLRTRLMVGADGARSAVRERAGIQTKGWGYDQHAVMAIVRTERSHQATCWQRFLEHGPLAFLPMHDNYSCIVWSTSPEQAVELLALDEAGFAARLAQAFDYKLGAVLEVLERGKFPLRLQHTLDYVKPRLALIGDAAHAIHPLAGQGVNLGVLDAAALAETVLAAHAAERDLGAMHTLRKYERWRKGQNLTMMLSMDGFKRLFGATQAPVIAVRNAGLKATNQVLPLKRLFMEYAVGSRGDLPQLAN